MSEKNLESIIEQLQLEINALREQVASSAAKESKDEILEILSRIPAKWKKKEKGYFADYGDFYLTFRSPAGKRAKQVFRIELRDRSKSYVHKIGQTPVTVISVKLEVKDSDEPIEVVKELVDTFLSKMDTVCHVAKTIGIFASNETARKICDVAFGDRKGF